MFENYVVFVEVVANVLWWGVLNGRFKMTTVCAGRGILRVLLLSSNQFSSSKAADKYLGFAAGPAYTTSREDCERS